MGPIVRTSLAVCLAASPALAQGGIRWPDRVARPQLTVRQVSDRDWVFCFAGWSTAVPAPDGPDDVGAGVGVSTGARSTNSANVTFVEEGTGDEAEMVLFPFVPEGAPFHVANIFRTPGDNLDWYGFIAPVSGTVPERAPGLLCFCVEFPIAKPFSQLGPSLLSTRVGVATVDATGQPVGSTFELAAFNPERATVLDYRFDRNAGDFAINYSGARGGAKTTGGMKAAPSSTPWVPGRFGAALRGDGSYCDTGWTGDSPYSPPQRTVFALAGSFTAAWFMKERSAPTSASHVFSGLGNFRCFTGAAAGAGLRCTGWTSGGSPASLDLNLDVQSKAQGTWVHVALVVDDEAGQARWYVDGQPVSTIAISGLAEIPQGAGSTFLIGGDANGSGHSTYDLDDFRLVNEPVDQLTIGRWSRQSPATGAIFSPSCGAALRTGVAPPRLGTSFSYKVEGPASSPYALLLGFRTSLGPLPLPVDLGLILPSLAGCPWHSSNDVSLAGVTNLRNIGVTTINIPSNPVLRSVALYDQAIFVGAGQALVTNAHAAQIE